jgi:hypothetical protein
MSKRVSDRFNALIIRLKAADPRSLPPEDRTIFYIVATRCEIDIGGFASVFDQLLDEDEVRFLIEALEGMAENSLAGDFRAALDLLLQAGFYEDPATVCYDLDDEAQDRLKGIGKRIQAGQRLWDLDEALERFVPST